MGERNYFRTVLKINPCFGQKIQQISFQFLQKAVPTIIKKSKSDEWFKRCRAKNVDQVQYTVENSTS